MHTTDSTADHVFAPSRVENLRGNNTYDVLGLQTANGASSLCFEGKGSKGKTQYVNTDVFRSWADARKWVHDRSAGSSYSSSGRSERGNQVRDIGCSAGVVAPAQVASLGHLPTVKIR